MNRPLPAFPAEIEGLRPSDEMTLRDHGEKYCTLPKDSAIKGMWIADMQPCVLPILRWIMDSKVYEISICKDSQGGVSVVCQVICGYFVEQEPSPIMVILADQGTAEFVSENRYHHMFTSHERYRNLIDQTQWTKERMGFINGAYLEMGWASSVAKMGTRSIRVVIADEIDKRGYNVVTIEGETLKLPESRLKTYRELSSAKYIKLSTPTDENGNITRQIKTSDIVYDCPAKCPNCGQVQPLNWWNDPTKNHWFPDGTYRGMDGKQHGLGRVVWEGGREASTAQLQETASYECGECKARWTDTERREAVRSGVEACDSFGGALPRSEPTGDEISVGYVMNDIGSCLTSLQAMIEAWVKVFRESNKLKRDKALQDFVNSRLGEPFEQVIIQSSPHEIVKAKVALEPQTVPQEATVLYAYFDQQKYGYWFGVRAFAPDFTSWLIHYGYLTSEQEIEDMLTLKTYPQNGTETGMKIHASGYDTGGTETDSEETMTERAYLFLCRMKRLGVRIWPTKGSAHPMPGRILKMGNKVQRLPSGQTLPFSLQLVILNTFELKAKFHRRLSYAIEGNSGGEMIPGSAYLHSGTDQQYISHITAEEKRIDKNGGEAWVKIRDRNDLLDVEAGLHALADPEWPGGGANLMGNRKPVTRRTDTTGNDRVEAVGPSPVMAGTGSHRTLNGRTQNPNFGRRLR